MLGDDEVQYFQKYKILQNFLGTFFAVKKKL